MTSALLRESRSRGRATLSILVPVLALAVAPAGLGCGDNNGSPPAPPDARLEPQPPDASTRASITFLVTVPADTSEGSKIHIAGDFQGWDPGSAAHELARQDDGRYAITLEFDVGTSIAFKFTRGSWAYVEKGPNGEELDNRTLPIEASGTQEFTVARWADGSPPPTTITGDVSTITVPGFLGDRRVWVYLPPDYDTDTEARYPVLYMFDGQNVFDTATSFAGEWQVDETLETGIAAGDLRPIIVVAVDNGGEQRIAEYTPWPADPYGGGEADAHLQAFTDALVPYIDQTYRTIAEPGSRAISGSSLGGLMSLYAAYEHDDVFGQVAALSPSLWWDGEHMRMHAQAAGKPGARIYMDMGTLEEDSTVDEDPQNGIDDNIDDLRAMRDTMTAQGFVLDTDLEVVEAEGHHHRENYWAMRFPAALAFLFPPAR
jgi:predicted alpha/beta superfamily hydrolase